MEAASGYAGGDAAAAVAAGAPLASQQPPSSASHEEVLRWRQSQLRDVVQRGRRLRAEMQRFTSPHDLRAAAAEPPERSPSLSPPPRPGVGGAAHVLDNGRTPTVRLDLGHSTHSGNVSGPRPRQLRGGGGVDPSAAPAPRTPQSQQQTWSQQQRQAEVVSTQTWALVQVGSLVFREGARARMVVEPPSGAARLEVRCRVSTSATTGLSRKRLARDGDSTNFRMEDMHAMAVVGGTVQDWKEMLTDGAVVLELWQVKPQESLVGIARIPLHSCALAFFSPGPFSPPRSARGEAVVVCNDYIPLRNPLTLAEGAFINTTVAVGSPQEVARFQRRWRAAKRIQAVWRGHAARLRVSSELARRAAERKAVAAASRIDQVAPDGAPDFAEEALASLRQVNEAVRPNWGLPGTPPTNNSVSTETSASLTPPVSPAGALSDDATSLSRISSAVAEALSQDSSPRSARDLSNAPPSDGGENSGISASYLQQSFAGGAPDGADRSADASSAFVPAGKILWVTIERATNLGSCNGLRLHPEIIIPGHGSRGDMCVAGNAVTVRGRSVAIGQRQRVTIPFSDVAGTVSTRSGRSEQYLVSELQVCLVKSEESTFVSPHGGDRILGTAVIEPSVLPVLHELRGWYHLRSPVGRVVGQLLLRIEPESDVDAQAFARNHHPVAAAQGIRTPTYKNPGLATARDLQYLHELSLIRDDAIGAVTARGTFRATTPTSGTTSGDLVDERPQSEPRDVSVVNIELDEEDERQSPSAAHPDRAQQPDSREEPAPRNLGVEEEAGILWHEARLSHTGKEFARKAAYAEDQLSREPDADLKDRLAKSLRDLGDMRSTLSSRVRGTAAPAPREVEAEEAHADPSQRPTTPRTADLPIMQQHPIVVHHPSPHHERRESRIPREELPPARDAPVEDDRDDAYPPHDAEHDSHLAQSTMEREPVLADTRGAGEAGLGEDTWRRSKKDVRFKLPELPLEELGGNGVGGDGGNDGEPQEVEEELDPKYPKLVTPRDTLPDYDAPAVPVDNYEDVLSPTTTSMDQDLDQDQPELPARNSARPSTSERRRWEKQVWSPQSTVGQEGEQSSENRSDNRQPPAASERPDYFKNPMPSAVPPATRIAAQTESPGKSYNEQLKDLTHRLLGSSFTAEETARIQRIFAKK